MAKSLQVVEIADESYKVPRDETGRLVRPSKMKDPEWNIACDASLPERNLPAYLKQHFRRIEMAQAFAARISDEEPPIAKFIVRAVKPVEYEVVDVTVAEKE